MKEIEVKTVRYVCENCGAEHHDLLGILKCAITGKEICTKCKCVVLLYNPIDETYQDVYIHPSHYSIQYEEYRDEYITKTKALYEEYKEKMCKLNVDYMNLKM